MNKKSLPEKRVLPPLLRLAPWAFLLTSLLWAIGCAVALDSRGNLRREMAANQIRYAAQAEASGDTRGADAAAAGAVQNLGGDGAAVAHVGQQLLRVGRLNTALRLLTKATHDTSVNDDPNVYLALNLAQTQVGNASAAKLALDEAERRSASLLAGKPSDKDQERVQGLIAVGDFWGDPENPSNLTDKDEKALKAFQAAYEAMPSSPETERAYALALAKFGTINAQFNDAVKLAQQAVEQLPGDPGALDALGWALFKSGDLAGAERVLRDAVEQDGDSPEIHYHLGAVFFAQKQPRDAAIELNRALQLWPRYQDAQATRDLLPKDVLPTPTPTPVPPPLNAPVSAPAVSAQLPSAVPSVTPSASGMSPAGKTQP